MPSFHHIYLRDGRRSEREDCIVWRFHALRDDHTFSAWNLRFWKDSRRFTVKPTNRCFSNSDTLAKRLVALYGNRPLITGRVTDLLMARLTDDDRVACARAALLRERTRCQKS